jgi:glycosyltransferase involved in cell wall biosynthesis
MSGVRIFYLDSFTQRNGEAEASDEIGYGITASSALKRELGVQGFDVSDLASMRIRATNKLAWIHASYALLQEVDLSAFDAIFIFHAHHQFPSEVRRVLCVRGRPTFPVIGYTHGSHFDPSDTFRTDNYPGMRAADLGNLLALDRVCVVSEYFRAVLLENVGTWSRLARSELEPRLLVTGLPIDGELIETYRTSRKPERVRIVFNHSPTRSKNPDDFLRIVEPVLRDNDVDLVMTRRFRSTDPGADRLRALKNTYGCRVLLGETLPLDAYYRVLWNSHIQVSTAFHESLGIATLEAMYTENCVVLPNRQVYPELVDDLPLYSTEEELANMLTRYVNDASLRQRDGSRMREASRRFLAPAVTRRIGAELEFLIRSQVKHEWRRR